jgi:hypothetical protein
MPTYNKVKIKQIEFFERLVANTYTNRIIKELLTEDQSEYITQLLSTLEEANYETDLDVIDKCKMYKYIARKEHEAKKKNNHVLNKLKELFSEQNGGQRDLYELLKVDYGNHRET